MRKPKKSLTPDEKKNLFLLILPQNRFNISRTCEILGIDRTLVYYWKDSDPKFARDLLAVNDIYLDYLQEKSLDLIEDGDGPQLRFELNARGKSRGYGRELAHKYPDGLPPPSQHLHLHLPPAPKSLAEWEAQVIEAREVRPDNEEKETLANKQKAITVIPEQCPDDTAISETNNDGEV